MNGKEFLGRGLKFPLQVDPRTGKLAMVDQEEDIREAIGIILRTGRGEWDYAFAPASSSMTHSIAHELRQLLLEQEPRIRDVEITCDRLDQQDGAVVLHIGYTVRSTNNRYNHVYPFYVTEGSEGGGAE